MELRTRVGLRTASREAGRGEVWAKVTAGEQPTPREGHCGRVSVSLEQEWGWVGSKPGCVPTTFQTRTATDPS